MLSMMKTMNFVFRIIQNSSEGVYKVCEGKDHIIVSHSQMGLTTIILVLGFIIPISMPVTNDLVSKEPNCAYTLKSTSKDMAIFCWELMQQYNSSHGAIKDMFSAAVNIDPVNSWGLGIAIESESNGETYWHSGINPGFQSLFRYQRLLGYKKLIFCCAESKLSRDYQKNVVDQNRV